MTAFPDSSITSPYLVGVLFGLGLCLLGAPKCFSIARRPSALGSTAS